MGDKKSKEEVETELGVAYNRLVRKHETEEDTVEESVE